MQNADDTGCSTEVLGIRTEGKQCLCGGIKEELEQQGSVAHNDTVEIMWQCKHNMVIFYRQKLQSSRFYPLIFFECATLRAVPVAAAMVLIGHMSAIVGAALVQVIAVGGGAAV